MTVREERKYSGGSYRDKKVATEQLRAHVTLPRIKWMEGPYASDRWYDDKGKLKERSNEPGQQSL